MLDRNTQLVQFTPGGGGGGHHQSPTRTLTADGQRVVDFANALPIRQRAAVASAFTAMGLSFKDFAGGATDLSPVMASNGPPRYDFHTGTYYDYGQGNDGVVICTDSSLLVVKHSRHDQSAAPA